MEQGREALFFYTSRKFTAGNRLFTNCAGKNMENFLFPEGISKKRNFIVSEEQTARYLGSGRSDVLATEGIHKRTFSRTAVLKRLLKRKK